MPLSPPADRERLHHRDIRCAGYCRDDGNWDIEGRLTDTKTYDFANRWRGRVRPNEGLHDMWVRLTVDNGLLIHAAEAATDSGPFEICGNITPNIRRLEGERIGPGWRRLIRQKIGGTEGCTHINELLGVLATVAYHTVFSSRSSNWARSQRDRPSFIDSCHTWASDGDAVRHHYPQHYTGSKPIPGATSAADPDAAD